MRMWHYFVAAAALCIPALLATALSGVTLEGGETHLMIGLVSGILVVGTHTLVIMFMIITGRILREAMRARPLGDEFLVELNEFFARRTAYPVAVLAAFLTVATGVLGYTARGFDFPPAVHVSAGFVALAVNVWALSLEVRVLRENQVLVDRAAAELDRLDRESPPEPEDDEIDAPTLERWGLILAVSAWMPWAYWAVIEHRGDFAATSVHPWLEGSLAGLLVWWLARRERVRKGLPPGPSKPPKRAEY